MVRKNGFFNERDKCDSKSVASFYFIYFNSIDSNLLKQTKHRNLAMKNGEIVGQRQRKQFRWHYQHMVLYAMTSYDHLMLSNILIRAI